jgi:hypothetical protein
VHPVIYNRHTYIIIYFTASILQTGEGTPGVTGYFEVGIENGKLLHSKKVRDV